MAFIASGAGAIRSIGVASSRSANMCSRSSSLSSMFRKSYCLPSPSLSRSQSQSLVVRMTSTSSSSSSSSSSPPSSTAAGKLPVDKDPAKVTENEWRQVLTREEFRVLRDKGTEYPGSGEYDRFYPKEGHFVCKACGNPLYSAESKFKSGCGWPAFDKCYKGSIKTKIDLSFGARRIEIMCSKCDSHLGHVFEDEGFTETNERHCVNSVSVKYVPGPADAEEDKLF